MKRSLLAAALLPAKVRERGTLVIGGTVGSPPLGFVADDNKTPIGIEIDIATLVASALGLKPDYQVTSWENLFVGLDSAKYDVGFSNITVTEKRKQKYDFAIYRKDDISFEAKKGGDWKITGGKDVAGKTIAVGTGTNQEKILVDWNEENVKAGLPAASIKYFQSPADTYLALSSGRIDAYFGPKLDRELVRLIETDLLRRADPRYSADLAVFNALLSVYAVLSVAITQGRLSDEDRVRHVETEWHGFFSFVASGPPPRRLEELLALQRAGLVRFAGPSLEVALSNDRFVASSPALPRTIEARAFVEARLPRPDVLATPDPLLTGLLESGLLAADELIASDGTSLGGGQLKADGECRAIKADGSVHPSLFLLGPSVSGSAGSSGFSRPYFNGPGFRQNDAVARNLLRQLAHTMEKAGQRHAS